MAGCETCRARPAALMEPASMMLRNTSICRRLNGGRECDRSSPSWSPNSSSFVIIVLNDPITRHYIPGISSYIPCHCDGCYAGFAVSIPLEENMHTTLKRTAATLLLSAAAALPFTSTAQAQSWPSRPITFVLPSAAGGSPDVLSRIVTGKLSEQLGVSVVVENKPGAAGSIGMTQLKRSEADGHTIGYGNINTLAVNRSLFKTLSYDVDADFVPVAHLFNIYNVLIVPAGSDIKSVDDLLKKARAQPGKMSYGASGVGTTGHMGGELFKNLAKID